jgi:hypothetical protein
MEWKGLNGIEVIWRHRWGWERNHHLWLHYSKEIERGRKGVQFDEMSSRMFRATSQMKSNQRQGGEVCV